MPAKPPIPLRPPLGEAKPTKPKITMNWEDWLPYLEDAEATGKEKREMIETLWSIVQGFVDAGWDASDAFNIGDEESCGKDFDLAAVLRQAVLQSEAQQGNSETNLTAQHAASVPPDREDAA